MIKRRNTFTRIGGSTYICHCCGRRTRHTGVQSLDSEMCPDCYELAGWDNMFNDDGRTPTETELAVCESHLKNIAKKGGDAERVKASNEFIWS